MIDAVQPYQALTKALTSGTRTPRDSVWLALVGILESSTCAPLFVNGPRRNRKIAGKGVSPFGPHAVSCTDYEQLQQVLFDEESRKLHQSARIASIQSRAFVKRSCILH